MNLRNNLRILGRNQENNDRCRGVAKSVLAALAVFAVAISVHASSMKGIYTQVAVGDPDFGGGANAGWILGTGLVETQLGPNGFPVLSASGISRLGTSADMDSTTHELLWWSTENPHVSHDSIPVQIDSLPLNFGYPYVNWYPTGQNGDGNYFRTVQWQGTFTMPTNGSISLYVQVDDDAWVFIDGKMVAEDHYGYVSNTTNSVSAGTHTLKLFYDDRLRVYDQIIFSSSVPLSPVPEPTAPVPPILGSFTNSVNFDMNNYIFDFNYNGPDGTVKYEYKPSQYNGSWVLGTFRMLQCIVDETNSFVPSYMGGFSLITTNGNEIFPWDATSFDLLGVRQIGDALQTTWRMNYASDSDSGSLIYNYQFQISGRTLVIHATTTNGLSGGIDLNRSYETTNAVVVGVPYLTSMNALYCYGAFCSFYFDWEETAASTINPRFPRRDDTDPNSFYFGQVAAYSPLTNGIRRNVDETIYLTASRTLADVLPTVPNPQSPNKALMANYLIFDNYQVTNAYFTNVNVAVESLTNICVSNLWVIVHDWQNKLFDNGYPDVLPPSDDLGGSNDLWKVSQTAANNGYLFALHENYRDFYSNALADPNPSYHWEPTNCALGSDGSIFATWTNIVTNIVGGITTIDTNIAHEIKPTKAAYYASHFAPLIHADFATTAAFLDVASSMNPSEEVDYDSTVSDAGAFHGPLSINRDLFSLLRNSHQGPISGEGFQHLLYLGYIDDVEAQIDAGDFETVAGQWLPLLVDFDLLKLHSLTTPHGVGYYERFFVDSSGHINIYARYSTNQVLEYMATELAYGHAGYIPAPDRVDNYTNVARLESTYVFPAQQLYAGATPVSIVYHDPTNADELTISDYIRRYPTTYADPNSVHFLGQVKITYDNGVVVCVNRHPTKSWTVTVGEAGGWFDLNATMSGGNIQSVGSRGATTYTLPATNGWLVFAPNPNLRTLSSDTNDYTFESGKTYWITQPIYISGTTVIQGGAILKYSGGVTLELENVDCQTSGDNPAILTSINDDNFGAMIPDSNHSPGIADYGRALEFDTSSGVYVHDVQINYACTGIFFNDTDPGSGIIYNSVDGVTVQNYNGSGIYSESWDDYEEYLYLSNSSFSGVGAGVSGYFWSGQADNINVSGGWLSNDDGSGYHSLYFTNSRFSDTDTSDTSMSRDGDNNGFHDTAEFGSDWYDF
jgi:hypothetical protein